MHCNRALVGLAVGWENGLTEQRPGDIRVGTTYLTLKEQNKRGGQIMCCNQLAVASLRRPGKTNEYPLCERASN